MFNNISYQLRSLVALVWHIKCKELRLLSLPNAPQWSKEKRLSTVNPVLILRYVSVFVLCLCQFFSFSQTVKVACIGNSVTFGLTHKDPSKTSYPSQLQNQLGPRYEVKNFGVSGATLLKNGHHPYYKTAAFTDLLSYKPDVAIIHLGLNDTDPRNWPNYGDEFMADYAWLIDTIRRVNPHVNIFVCQLTPIFNGHPRFLSGTRDWYWQIQQLIPQIAKANKAGMIDLHTPLYFHPELLPDNLHPNEEGASIIANVVYHKLTGDFGGLQLPSVFASHMVLQRDQPIKFYGTANAKEKITVAFNGKSQSVLTNEDGKWESVFPALPNGGPLRVTISSLNKVIILDDVLIGDVWLCSGQSNMAFPLRSSFKGKEELVVAQNVKGLRLLDMKVIAETNNTAWDSAILDKVNKLQYFNGTWHASDSAAATDFSAVAYYFGKRLQEQLHVPIGLILVAVGGSDTESWIDRYTMEHDPQLVQELYNWRRSDFYQPWVRERAETNLKNSADQKQRHPYEPCYNYEAGISQFIHFPVKGVIWYQGESNAHNIELHEILFPKMVKSWRKKWGYDFPFYYVQLSSLNRPSWTAFRNSQLGLLKIIPNAGMAVSNDVGDSLNVHPIRKKEVGARLARLALNLTYHQTKVVPYGPLPLKAQRVGNQIIISFQYSGQQLHTQDKQPLRGFVLQNEKGIQKEAKALIQKNQVIIPLQPNDQPRYVLYAWKPYTDANLINEDQLPASTFKIEIQ